MDFFEVIQKRYSHKQTFLPNAVGLDCLEAIAAAGLAAPTGGNAQAVRLIILKDKQTMEPLCEIINSAQLHTAPSAIVLFTDSATQTGSDNFEMEDYSAATENMILATFALGYVTNWLDSPFFELETVESTKRLLGVPNTYTPRIVLPIGLPNGEGTRRSKLPFNQRVSYGYFNKGKEE